MSSWIELDYFLSQKADINHIHTVNQIDNLENFITNNNYLQIAYAHSQINGNAHSLTKEQIGLSEVDNIKQIPLSQKGVAEGVVPLDLNSKISPNFLYSGNFGNNYIFNSNVDEFSTTSNSFIPVVSLNFSILETGVFRISSYCEIRQGTANRYVMTQLRVNSNVIASSNVLLATNLSSVSVPICKFNVVTLQANQIYNVVLEFCRGINGGTAYIKNSIIEMWRVQ